MYDSFNFEIPNLRQLHYFQARGNKGQLTQRFKNQIKLNDSYVSQPDYNGSLL